MLRNPRFSRDFPGFSGVFAPRIVARRFAFILPDENINAISFFDASAFRPVFSRVFDRPASRRARPRRDRPRRRRPRRPVARALGRASPTRPRDSRSEAPPALVSRMVRTCHVMTRRGDRAPHESAARRREGGPPGAPRAGPIPPASTAARGDRPSPRRETATPMRTSSLHGPRRVATSEVDRPIREALDPSRRLARRPHPEGRRRSRGPLVASGRGPGHRSPVGRTGPFASGRRTAYRTSSCARSGGPP